MAEERLETERLIGRAPASGQAVFDDLCLIYKDLRAMDTLSADGKPHADETILAIGNRWADHWQVRGFGPRLFHDRESGDFIGYGGLRPYEVDGVMETELLYGLRPDYWRQGYGTELARASVEEGFTRFGFPSIVAFTLTRNLGSQGVMKSVGMVYEKDIVHAELPHVFYRIRQS